MQAAEIADRPLSECLRSLRATFDLDQIAGQKIALDDVAEYYQQSDAGYRLFHSSDGALHLALNHNGSFDPAGYYAQAEFVERHLENCLAQRILEAGSGNGFNTLHLAKKHPQRQFVGIDLTAQHIAAAREAAHGLTNLEYIEGDYEAIDFPDGHFDLAFGVETFCQTADMQQALKEIARALRPGGRLVVVDCFRQRPLSELDVDLQLAAKLVEKTTAVDGFAVIEQWLDLAGLLGFDVLEVRDESAHVVQNLAHFYRLARIFRRPKAGRGRPRVRAAIDAAKCHLRIVDALYRWRRCACLLFDCAPAAGFLIH